MARRSLVPPSVTGWRRTVLLVVLVVVAVAVFAALYPLLRDLGAELYRAVAGG